MVLIIRCTYYCPDHDFLLVCSLPHNLIYLFLFVQQTRAIFIIIELQILYILSHISLIICIFIIFFSQLVPVISFTPCYIFLKFPLYPIGIIFKFLPVLICKLLFFLCIISLWLFLNGSFFSVQGFCGITLFFFKNVHILFI